MNDTIEEFENEAYCVMRSADRTRPIIQESWFPTGLNAHSLQRSYGDDIIGRKLDYEQGWGFYFRTPNGSRITVPTTNKYPARYVEVPIEPPKSRLPIEWRDGTWWKETKRGWVPWYQ
jgi:hypothetical protein